MDIIRQREARADSSGSALVDLSDLHAPTPEKNPEADVRIPFAEDHFDAIVRQRAEAMDAMALGQDVEVESRPTPAAANLGGVRPAPSDGESDQPLRETRRLYEDGLRRFDDFILASSDWIWETDHGGALLHVSDGLTETAGKPARLLIGKRLADIGEPPAGHAGDSALEDIEARRPFRGKAIDVTHQKGAKRRCLISGMPVFDAATGRFLGYRGTGVDVSSQFEAAENLREYRRQLEITLEETRNKNLHLELALAEANATNRTKNEFLANVSHELRTPLNAIMGFAEIMDREMFGAVGSDRYRQYMRDIFDSAEHLLGVIGDLLDMSKIEAGKLELREERVLLSEAVESCQQLMAKRANDAGVSFTSGLPDNLPSLQADLRMVKQMLLNLFSNGIKFTPRGGTVSVEARLLDDGNLSVSVSDTGVGIAEKDFSKVMSPFGQVENSLVRRHDGTGLGLPLVSAMIELHGGALNLKSELGVGTTVTLCFPAERVETRAAT